MPDLYNQRSFRIILPQMDNPQLTETQLAHLADRRRRLLGVMALSSGLDIALSVAGASIAIPTFGGSVLLEEVVEYLISVLLAGSYLSLKKRYKLIGFLPVPGVTALSVQCLFELRKINRRPHEVLKVIGKG